MLAARRFPSRVRRRTRGGRGVAALARPASLPHPVDGRIDSGASCADAAAAHSRDGDADQRARAGAGEVVQSAARLRVPDPGRWNSGHLRPHGDLAALRHHRVAARPVRHGALWAGAEGDDGGGGPAGRRPAGASLPLALINKSLRATCRLCRQVEVRSRRLEGVRHEDAPICYDRGSSIEAPLMRRSLPFLVALSLLILPMFGIGPDLLSRLPSSLAPVLAPRLDAAELQPLEIASRSGVHSFVVEMAVTPDEQAKGLMFRRELPEGQGMLFDFHREQPATFWMKNTYVSLDMIFIRGDGRILRIAENTVPLSEALVPSGGPVRAVLEVVAGTAKKFGIAPGDRVAHPIFNGG